MLAVSHVLALIPARGGSKGIPRKNLAKIAGRSLVARSVDHARGARAVTRVMVSTEDDEIAAEALASGAEVLRRPVELAGDTVLDQPVFAHALRALAEVDGYRPDLVVHLRPTAPHREPRWIDEAVELLAGHPAADSVRSVSLVEQHPYRVFRIGPDGYLVPIMAHEHPAPFLLRRQELPPMHFYNCVIDVTRPSTIEAGEASRSMTGARILPWVMRAEDVLDVDTPRDLQIARHLLEAR